MLVKRNQHLAATLLEEDYACRSVPPEASEWISTLPEPDPATPKRYHRTQELHLYEAARRLAWEFDDSDLATIKTRLAEGAERSGPGLSPVSHLEGQN